MISFLVLILTLLRASFALNDTSYQTPLEYHFENYLNNSVAPCDDFYQRICSRDIPNEDTLMGRTTEWIKNELSPYYPEEQIDRLNYMLLTSSVWYSERRMEGLKEKILTKCQNNTSAYQKFYCQFLSCEKFTCETASENWYSYLKNEFVSFFLKPVYLETLSFFDNIAQISAWYNYIRDEQNEYLAKHAKIEQIFQQIKELTEEKLLDSYWVKKNNLESQVKLIIAAIHLHVWTPSDQMNEILRDIMQNYTECINTMSTQTLSIENNLCFFVAVLDNGNQRLDMIGGVDKTMMIYPAVSFNAYYSDQKIVLHPNAYGLLEVGDEQSAMALLGSVIAHEIGHGIFENKRNFMPAEYPENVECVKEHMQEACDRFSGNLTCASVNATIPDDAADWTSVVVMEQLFKKWSENGIQNLPAGITSDQYYFYLHGILWCLPSQGESRDHSFPKLRINGMFMQSEKFANAFQCKKGDPMVASKKCFLFGENATRRR